jgi:plastocyanin
MKILRSWRVAAVLAALLTAAAPPVSAEQSIPTSHRVEIRQFKFVPETLEVAPGDTITWVNLDIVPHTVTALDASWDSANLDPDMEWSTSVSASMSGEYFCKYHPSMLGEFEIARAQFSEAMAKSVPGSRSTRRDLPDLDRTDTGTALTSRM